MIAVYEERHLMAVATRKLLARAAHQVRLVWSWRRAGQACRWHLPRFG